MSPPTTSCFPHDRPTIKTRGFGNRIPAVTVSVPGRFPTPSRPGPVKDRLKPNLRRPPSSKRQVVEDVTPRHIPPQIEELTEDEQEGDAHQQMAPLPNQPNLHPSQSNRGPMTSQARSQVHAQAHANKPAVHKHGGSRATSSRATGTMHRPVSSFEGDPTLSDPLAQSTRTRVDRSAAQTGGPSHQPLYSHEWFYHQGIYNDANLPGGDFSPTAALFNTGAVWQDTHAHGNAQNPEDTHEHQLRASDSFLHPPALRSSSSSGSLEAPASQAGHVCISSRVPTHGAHNLADQATISDRLGYLQGLISSPAPPRVPFSNPPAPHRQPRGFQGQQQRCRSVGRARQDRQPTCSMSSRSRGGPPLGLSMSQQKPVQQALFTGSKFSSPMSPLQSVNLTTIWQNAFNEAKRQREAPCFNLFHALDTYQKDIAHLIDKMTDFVHNLQGEQESLESEVDKSVRKLEHKSTLYEKAREKATSVCRTARPWEAKRSHQ